MKQTQEHIRKRVESRKRNGNANLSAESRLKISINRKGKNLADNHPLWKGLKVGYQGLHQWIRTNFKKPDACEKCGTKQSLQFNWSMNHGTRTRKRKDWRYLCRRCHILYDKVWEKNRGRNELGQFVPL